MLFINCYMDMLSVYASADHFCRPVIPSNVRGVSVTDGGPLNSASKTPCFYFRCLFTKHGSHYNSSLFCHESLVSRHVPRFGQYTRACVPVWGACMLQHVWGHAYFHCMRAAFVQYVQRSCMNTCIFAHAQRSFLVFAKKRLLSLVHADI